jgi:hypothetical protein
MKKTLRDRIAALSAMDVPALREEHRRVFGKDPVSAHRQFLFRKIAWRMQADREGGLPDSARELARAIARDAPLRIRVISNAEKLRGGIPLERTTTTTIAPGHDSRLPMPGGLIVKQFRGETIVVKVVDEGFEYRDRRYGSLSAIAQEITGTKWNGFLFFGLTKEKANGRR